MSAQPKISVILPLYNVEKYIRACLDALCSQTLTEIEIIIVNDGSTDQSPEICEEYARRDERIKVIHQENRSSLIARCVGVNASNGKYILFVDPDDYVSVDAARDLYAMIEHHQVDALHFSVRKFDELTGKIFTFNRGRPFLKTLDGEALRRRCIGFAKSQPFGGFLWNKIYRADIVKQAISFVDMDYCYLYQDEYLSFLILWHANSYRGIRTQPYYFYRSGTGVTSGEISLQKFSRYCDFAKMHASLERFLLRHDRDHTMSHVVESMRMRHLLDVFGAYVKITSDVERKIARSMILEAFPAEAVQRAILVAKGSWLNKVKYALFSKMKFFSFHQRYGHKLQAHALLEHSLGRKLTD